MLLNFEKKKKPASSMHRHWQSVKLVGKTGARGKNECIRVGCGQNARGYPEVNTSTHTK
jgi:hypothetical protein